MTYYNRQGDLISADEWGKLFSDKSYKIIKKTTLPDGTLVSTVWLGMEHGYGPTGPIIFETMVFDRPGADEGDEEQYRYATEEEALKHHHELVGLEWHANDYSSSKDVRRWQGVADDIE